MTQEQEPPRTVRLYKEVALLFDKSRLTNFNHWMNIFAAKGLGMGDVKLEELMKKRRGEE